MSKTIKAWAIIGRKNLKIRKYGLMEIAILAVFQKEKQAMADCAGIEKVVPCEITLNPPKKAKLKITKE